MKLLLCLLLLLLSMTTFSDESIRVITEHLPPYQIVENHTLVGGTSLEIMYHVLQRAGYPKSIEVLPWARAYHIALNEKNVVIFSMTRSSDRESLFQWIGSLRQLNYYFYSLKTNTHIQLTATNEALKYKAVAVRNSFEAQTLIKQGFIPDKNLILTSNYLNAWNILLKGRADITFANALIGDGVYKIISMSTNPFVKQDFVVEKTELFVAASKNTSKAIILKLQTALESIKQDGTFDHVLSNKTQSF